jgi:hypothetical protein
MKTNYTFIKTWWSKEKFAAFFRKNIIIEFYDYDFNYVDRYYYSNRYSKKTETIRVFISPSFNLNKPLSKLKISKVLNSKTVLPEFYMGHN